MDDGPTHEGALHGGAPHGGPTGTTGPAALLAGIERESARLGAAGRAGLDAPVPACPGWTVEQVLGHVGRVYRSVREHVVRRATEPVPGREIPKPPAGDAVLAWYDEARAALLDALRTAAPDDAVWTWSDDHRVAFYLRRMCHETAVHRYDAQVALGEPDPFDPDLAADAVAELYEVVLPFGVARRPELALPAGSLHLHRTDGPGEWTVRAVGGRVVTTREHGKGDAAVRGPASDLCVFAWHRGRPATLEVFGDATVADAWAALAP